MKRKILLSPLIIVILIIVAGVSIAGAAILIGTTQQGETNSQSVNLQKGLIGNWDFNGNAKDKTLYANDGTLNGDTVLTTDRKGQSSKAYAFDGTGDYVNIGDKSIFDFGVGQDFTFSLWIKRSETGISSHYVLAKGAGGTADVGFAFIMSGGRTPVFFLSKAGEAGRLDITSDTNITDATTWHHIIGTFDRDGNGILYLDGVQHGSEDISGYDVSLSNSKNLTIGSYSTGSTAFPGSIDDVRIYNRALSSAEITALYQEYNPGIQVSDLQKGLVGNWDFNGNAKDKTLYANDGTVTGATLTADRKGQDNKAYNFNGTTDNIEAASSNSLNVTGEVTIEAWVYDP